MYPLLTGLRVVECASFIAAPSCGLYMSQLGADVIRIDPIGGGPDMARWPLSPEGASLYWQGLNKGKRSVAIDLSKPEGRDLCRAVIAAPGEKGGLLLTNYPAEGFLAHDRLAQSRADLITLRVMGWPDGRPAVDYTINAAVGLPFMTGPAELDAGQPVNHVLPAWDLVTGGYAAFAMMAALHHRTATGLGQEVRLPLSDMALVTLANLGQVAETLTTGERGRFGNDLFGAIGRDFATSDGVRIMVVAITGRQWTGLVAVLDIAGAVAALEAELGCSFETQQGARFTHRSRLVPIVADAIGGRSADDLATVFDAQGVCWSRYRTLGSALAQEPALSPSGPLFSQVNHPLSGAYPTPGAPGTFVGLQRGDARPAAELGADTDEVLSDVLGLSEGAIGRLHDQGLI